MTDKLHSDHHIVTEQLGLTIVWLMQHQDVFDSLSFDTQSQQLIVKHAAGEDLIREGMYLTAQYGILVTS
ncbi:hypothetical protein IAE19_02970 [Acinetobacter sp. S40]|uniref:hypothetical protein n=1 Tax=Acinetobacter sp. S40 TaxID=2767434 RepID=UPI00190A9CD6|nr:hypothetical protein [Acinetobacter sp. S40]MBJ9984403.1 hypothetical protein [Acinetobacter sp. S40]